MLDSLSFSNLYDLSSPANKACLLSASASLATSWVSVLPSGEPGMHFDPSEFRSYFMVAGFRNHKVSGTVGRLDVFVSRTVDSLK